MSTSSPFVEVAVVCVGSADDDVDVDDGETVVEASGNLVVGNAVPIGVVRTGAAVGTGVDVASSTPRDARNRVVV